MNNNIFTSLLYGWIVIFGIMLSSSFILSVFLKFSYLKETNYSWVTLTISFIALFIGGIVAGVQRKVKGWLTGGLTGLGFSLFVFLIQFLGFNQTFSSEQIIVHGAFILLAVLGGIIGVNIFVGKSS